MASLKEIMNYDEENLDTDVNKRDKASVPRFSDAADTISSASRYASSTEPPITSSSDPSDRTSTSSHRLHSLVPGTATSSPSSSAPDDRRRSNTSTDSMDPPYYGYPQGPHGTGGQPSRAYASSGSGGEAPIKLTPITGRVSRAKKGVPVHTCELCRPPKTFTRAEHLRRHQLSHQPPDLQCSVPGCDKVFHRRDLLERHQLRHEQETRAHGDAPRTSSRHSGGSGSSYMGMPSSGAHFQMQPTNMGLDSDMPIDSGSWSNLGDGPVHGHSSMPSSYGHSSDGYRLQPVYTGGQHPYPWADNSGVSSVTSVSPNSIGAYSTSSSRPGADWDEPTGAFSIAPSASGYYAYGTSPPAGPASSGFEGAMGMPLGGYPEDAAMHSPDALMNTSAVRSLSPSLAVGQSSETLVTMPASLPSHRITSRQVDCDHQSEDLFGLTTSFANASLSLDHESRSAIPSYLNVYWDRVYHLHPIVHRSIFEKFSDAAPEQLEILQCALAAVATQFLEDHSHRINGHRLYMHAWNSAKMYTQTSEWPLPIMLAILNCEYYALYRGRKKESHRPSARFAKLYQIAIDQHNMISPTSPSQRGLCAWQSWVDFETRRRILAACFLLDVHSMIYYEQPPMVIRDLDYSFPSSLSISLTATTVGLWEATDYEKWGQLMDQGQPSPENLGSLMSKSLSPNDVAAMPLIDASLLQAACALRLPRRQDLTKVEILEDALAMLPEESLPMLFPTCPVANVYMALHCTPLHVMLSVSGESWVFNKKISRAGLFTQHKVELESWRRSDHAAIAVSFAARALRYFFNLTPDSLGEAGSSFIEHGRGVRWKSLSDFWGVYVCALICWSFGYGEKRKQAGSNNDASRQTAVRWLLTASELKPGELYDWPECKNTLAVVCLVRDVLARDCVGGRNILFADSVNVLRKLAGRTSGSESESD